MLPSQIIELLLILLIAASLIAVLASRFRIPYTIALVIGGFAINFFHVPIANLMGGEAGATRFLTPEIVFTLFLPVLLFEAGLNLNLAQLRANALTIGVLAVGGVAIAMFITGYAVHLVLGLPLMPALLFGALISATDPISVLAMFKDLGAPKRLASLIEGESLFNDGTAVVLFQILLTSAIAGGPDVPDALRRFIVLTAGGAALGLILGYAASRITSHIDDPRIEITLTTILAYGAYLLSEQLKVSGVMATVGAGLMIGNFGAEIGMSPRTRVALWAYWDYLSFVVNSLVFLLIGIEVHVFDLLRSGRAVLLALAAVLLGRALAVYVLIPATNLKSPRVPASWQHLLVWGGIHGGVSMALALSIDPAITERNTILTMTFGVVAFSIVVQGLTLKPFLRVCKIGIGHEDDYDRARAGATAIGAARRELEILLENNAVTRSVYDRLREELEGRQNQARAELAALESREPASFKAETYAARLRLLAAEKSAIQRSVHEGLISGNTAEKMLAAADKEIDKLNRRAS
jgi:monovalent cation:H+ antiporter, CPA1 family